jgi:hypothetical protein
LGYATVLWRRTLQQPSQQDTVSQTAYGLRELVDVDEELWSDNECLLRAKAVLATMKDPFEYIKA